ncbi:MAG: hypothetical protein ACE5O2_12310, partial [Armatimonadota bacterium]
MPFYDNAFDADPGLIARAEDNRQHLLRIETEDFLRELTEQYPERQNVFWQRDYSSEEAYIASVRPTRQRW